MLALLLMLALPLHFFRYGVIYKSELYKCHKILSASHPHLLTYHLCLQPLCKNHTAMLRLQMNHYMGPETLF